jgi:hypothetical protein
VKRRSFAAVEAGVFVMENTGKYGCRTFFTFRGASGFPAALLLTGQRQVAKLLKKI